MTTKNTLIIKIRRMAALVAHITLRAEALWLTALRRKIKQAKRRRIKPKAWTIFRTPVNGIRKKEVTKVPITLPTLEMADKRPAIFPRFARFCPASLTAYGEIMAKRILGRKKKAEAARSEPALGSNCPQKKFTRLVQNGRKPIKAPAMANIIPITNRSGKRSAIRPPT